jgi:hypothetical protein
MRVDRPMRAPRRAHAVGLLAALLYLGGQVADRLLDLGL